MKALKMTINTRDKRSHINREIYGNFTEHLGRCIYNGIYVGEDSEIPNTRGIRNDIVEAFKEIGMPVLRWPGGCFADEYHWRDGIGEKSQRPKMINTNWGGVTEDNSFGTHEFFDLCEQVGCEPYIAGNVGSGTVEELSKWVEYMTSDSICPMADERRKNGRDKAWKLKYLGIGNENWGCGGNMTPEYYSSLYKQFRSFCKNHSGNELYPIACGPSSSDYNWTEVMMKNLKGAYGWQAKGLALHFYSIPDWNNKGKATEFDEEDYYRLLGTVYFTDELLTRHTEVMNRYDPEGEVALIVDEWGNWFDVEDGTNPGFLFQQNAMRDAITAAISLNTFNAHSKRVKMANIAQAVNVLQSVILTEGEALVKTPTFYVFKLFKGHQEGELVYSHIENETVSSFNVPAVSQSVSVKDGVMTVTLSNCSLTESYEIEADILGFDAKTADAEIITAEVHAFNDFNKPEQVTAKAYDAQIVDGRLKVTLPACSVVAVTVK
ncbi:alpha-L-arabinofuranosidase C-terminal domain-containing protein [Ruminococcus sp. NK3A76]|uniref:alpha-N-arabinofuranosidase n=1 Tax=Ruminococcus sp. NK3A76 TaxID=877411 RepID=UPI00048F3D7B|nr:alpha-L-arabinofuranosidase C-terminal domain-containing protein [Ruminococcus sp. NK3A76]